MLAKLQKFQNKVGYRYNLNLVNPIDLKSIIQWSVGIWYNEYKGRIGDNFAWRSGL